MIVDLTEVQPLSAPRADAVTVAVLSSGTPDWLAVLAATGARVLCVGEDGASFLPQDRPDVLIVDSPLVLSARRTALLIRQLTWSKPDLVVLVADGMLGQVRGFDHDLSFDPALGAAHVEDAFAVARHLLCHSRLRAPVGQRHDQPALLRRDAPRRADLFR